MIRQYLSNTNESATIPILQKILELNKALLHNTYARIKKVKKTSVVIFVTVLSQHHICQKNLSW